MIIQFYQIPCVSVGGEFPGSHRKLRTPSEFGSFILGGGGGGGGGGGEGWIYPILLHPNTQNLLLLLFYTTTGINFGRCPIYELTTNSPRMVNNSTMHPHPT